MEGIRTLVDWMYDKDRHYCEFAGKSTATKPVGKLVSGSRFTEIDTGVIYVYDEEGAAGKKWLIFGGKHGIPSGGTTGQILKKSSGTDYAVEWANNTLNGLSDVSASSPYPQDVLAVGANGDWESTSPEVGLGACEDDGGGNIVWDYDLSVNENDPANMSPLWYKTMYDIETDHNLEFLWRTVEYDGDDNEVKKTYYFIDRAASTPFAPSIKRFVTELLDDEWTPATLQTSPAVAHEVARQWVGTAAEYAALSPNYDANTMYFIKEA